MATTTHPVTGVEINELTIVRKRRLTEDEKRTARLLMNDGDPRWLAAAKLGVHPLGVDSPGRAPNEGRTNRGAGLPLADARRDPRQIDLLSPDLAGPEPVAETDHSSTPTVSDEDESRTSSESSPSSKTTVTSSQLPSAPDT